MEQDTDLETVRESLADNEVSYANSIASMVHKKFSQAKTSRESQEEIWLQAYKDYRGEYQQFREEETSHTFVKVTKTKVLAAYGQITEVLLGGSKFPISIQETTIPDGVAGEAHFSPKPNPNAPKELPELKPGDTRSLSERMGILKDKTSKLDLKEGHGRTPDKVTLYPAKEAATRMEKNIHDQLEESSAKKHLRSVAFECSLFGTGVMKGPFLENKEYPKWDKEGNYKPVFKKIPKVTSTSVWNFYPDPDATTSDELTYVVERHKMSRTQLRSLNKRPEFRESAIDRAVDNGCNYIREDWENVMEQNEVTAYSDRYEVLEFWGYVDVKTLKKDLDFEVPSSLKDAKELSVNIWVCGGEVLRMVMNPFTPSRIPFFIVPYEVNPYSLWGVGVAENMADTQSLMNGFMRLSVDNAAKSGNLVFEIDESNLTPGQDLDVYPGKVFKRQGGAPGQAIFATQYPNVSQQNMQLFDKARQLADESTGLPSFSHGQTGVTGVGRTASGISMLMSAANGAVRTVVKNFDDYLLAPLGKSLFAFNMQFNFEELYTDGDLEVKAGGTDNLMANEVRSQRLMQFLQVVQNPVLAPFAKMDYIVEEIAKSLGLDPEKVVNSMSEAAIQAALAPPAPEQPQGGPQGPQAGTPPGLSPQDTTGSGGGVPGTGTAPVPGEEGFSANTGEGEAA